jgi:YgiT-type zinc finger domain-containing protein
MTDTEPTPEGMACTYCPTGTYQKSTTTMTLERGDATLVVKHVPAYVCSHCGDAMLSEAVSERLDGAMEAAVAAGDTTVRTYDPEKATA